MQLVKSTRYRVNTGRPGSRKDCSRSLALFIQNAGGLGNTTTVWLSNKDLPGATTDADWVNVWSYNNITASKFIVEVAQAKWIRFTAGLSAIVTVDDGDVEAM